MNHNYKILDIKLKPYTHIIFSIGHINPLDQKESIEKDLKAKGEKGKILFDLLLSHGNNPDRFYEASFDGERIDEYTLKATSSISRTIKSLSLKFYQKQNQYLENSILSKAQRFLIKKGRLK